MKDLLCKRCGKIAYATMGAALEVARLQRIRDKSVPKLEAYKCKRGFFHLSSHTKHKGTGLFKYKKYKLSSTTSMD